MQQEYALIPPDRRVVTEYERVSYLEAKEAFATAQEGWKLVRSSNYPFDKDAHGVTLYPIVAILKVKR